MKTPTDCDDVNESDDSNENDYILGTCMKTPTDSGCTSTDFGAADTLPDLLVGRYKYIITYVY